MLVAVFAWVNGLSPEFFMEWALLMRLCRDESARRHFIYLFGAFKDGKYKKYYAWNVSVRR